MFIGKGSYYFSEVYLIFKSITTGGKYREADLLAEREHIWSSCWDQGQEYPQKSVY